MSEDEKSYSHPAYDVALSVPGLSVAVSSLDALLSWGSRNSLWIFPMATSCCGIELMAAAAARVDLDRMGTIVRSSPRQADVMVVAGTITVKMAPRVRRLWDQMPEPKWCVAMGSCAISGDFYRDIYSVVPGIDTVIPVDVYVPGCPPNPESLMEGLLRLQEKIARERKGGRQPAEPRPPGKVILPVLGRLDDPERDPAITLEQTAGTKAPGDLAGEVKVIPQLPGPARALPADFATLLRDRFGLEADPALAALIPAERHLELASALRDAGYRLFTFVVASHWPAPPPKEGEAPKPEEFEVAYGLRKPEPGAPLASWRLRVTAGEEVDSLAMLFAGADWQEREQWDLVGVRFRGHPDLRRIMLPQAWEGHPLRRDYPIETPHRPWR